MSSSGDDGGGGWIDSLGSSARATLENFASDPRGYILGIVAVWFVENVLRATGAVLASVGDALEQLARIPEIVGAGVGALGVAVFDALAATLSTIWFLAVGAADAAGPFGPIVAVVVLYLVAVAVEFLVRWLVRLVGNYVGLT